ncbi:MAG: LysR family transcriptional regulator [Papillibacter sp.]|nr:LysR family transcriptional regulator [Papillibacter sp.]
MPEDKLLENDITFQQIQSFLVIAKNKNLSKAANELYISQPALSKTLKRLEDSIGVPLFIRSNQGVTLTDAGKELYLTFNSIYDNLESTIRHIRTLTPERKLLHIAVPHNYDHCEDYLPIKQVINRYTSSYPNVQVIESLFDLKPLCRSIEVGGVDMVLIPSFVQVDTPLFKRKHLSEIKLCMVVSSTSKVKDLKTPAAFENEVVFAMSTTDRASDMEFNSRICSEIGFKPKKIDFPPNIQTTLHAVHSGLGVGICWKYDYSGSEQNVRFIGIPADISRSYIDIVWNPSEVIPEAQQLIRMLSQRNDS